MTLPPHIAEIEKRHEFDTARYTGTNVHSAHSKAHADRATLLADRKAINARTRP